MADPDVELLARFARSRDQAAFAELVSRYAGVVYAAALRQVGAAHAEDVSQTVFFILAQKADRVDGHTLGGWLVNAARFAALASRRAETRRRHREQKALHMNPDPSPAAHDASPDWEAIGPMLDEALAKLDTKDRSALTLRYLQGKSVRDVAAAMNLTEAAAGKRATRAVERLRSYFARRGVTLSSQSLGAALATHGVVLVPVELAGKLAATGASGAALTGGAAGLLKGTLSLMVTAKTQAAVVGVVALLLVGGGVAYFASQSSSPQQASVAPDPTTRPAAREVPLGPPTTIPPLAGDPAYTLFDTPAGEPATFSGKVVGAVDPGAAEIGVVSLKGVQWTSNNNYQWKPLESDGTFKVTAKGPADVPCAIAVRMPGQVAQYFPVDFDAGKSAHDIVFALQPTKPIAITATTTAGEPIKSFKVEIFDESALGQGRMDHRGKRRKTQRLDAPLSIPGDNGGGVVMIAVPLEPICLMFSGNGLAPDMVKIDPREKDAFSIQLLKATPIEGFLTDNGKPIAGEKLMLNNPAVAFSYTARTTDANGRFTLPSGIPGTYFVNVRGQRVKFTVKEGEPCRMDIDVAKLPASPTTQPDGDR